jgi:hypothetical protein
MAFSVLRQRVASMWSAACIGPAEKTTTRPLLVSPPVKLKRKLADDSSMRYDEYAVSRYVRDKHLRGTPTGKQEQLAFDSGMYAPIAFAAHKTNEQIALQARVLQEQLPAPGLGGCVAWVRANRRELFPRIDKVNPVEFGEYLRRVGSSPAVKASLAAARERLVVEGWSYGQALSPEQVHRFVKRSSFGKVENLLYSSPAGMKEKAPRLIQGAQAEFVCIVGPWIMALQDLVCRRWKPGRSNLVFTSGVTAESAAAHITGRPGEMGYDDIESFDLDQSRPWGELMRDLSRAWGAPLAVVQLIDANIDTVGKTHGGWRYKCKGTRKSGDPYTSLFNTIINVVSHLYIFCKIRGIGVREAAEHFWMVAQGDDNAFAHDGPRISWRAEMLLLGFKSEATYAKEDQIEFCSMRLYNVDGGRWVFGPKPGRVMAKFGYAINRPPHVSAAAYVRGVALSQLKGAEFVPPLKAFFARVLALTSHVPDQQAYRPRHLDYQLRVARVHEATARTMYGLSENYYWDYAAQEDFEKFLRKAHFGDTIPIRHQIQLFDLDTDGPKVLYHTA